MIECRTCPEPKDQFGNYVWCPLLRRFVDWEYWHGTCAEDCPKKGGENQDD